jgi:hypothetical protein
MSTSLLYHAFGIRGYEYVRTEYQGGEVIFTINQDLKTCRCSACGSNEIRPRGSVERRFRALPIGSRRSGFPGQDQLFISPGRHSPDCTYNARKRARNTLP